MLAGGGAFTASLCEQPCCGLSSSAVRVAGYQVDAADWKANIRPSPLIAAMALAQRSLWTRRSATHHPLCLGRCVRGPCGISSTRHDKQQCEREDTVPYMPWTIQSPTLTTHRLLFDRRVPPLHRTTTYDVRPFLVQLVEFGPLLSQTHLYVDGTGHDGDERVHGVLQTV